MANPREKMASCDPVWDRLRQEAETIAEREPALAGFVHAAILKHEQLENALSYHMAGKLGGFYDPQDETAIFDARLANARQCPGYATLLIMSKAPASVRRAYRKGLAKE